MINILLLIPIIFIYIGMILAFVFLFAKILSLKMNKGIYAITTLVVLLILGSISLLFATLLSLLILSLLLIFIGKNSVFRSMSFSLILLFSVMIFSLGFRAFIMQPYVYTGENIKQLQKGDYFFAQMFDRKFEVGDIVLFVKEEKTIVGEILETDKETYIIQKNNSNEKVNYDNIVGEYWFTLFSKRVEN